MKTKTFDCVEMKHAGGRRVYQEIKGMTTKEELAFWRRREARLHRRIRAARGKRAGASTAAKK